MKVRIISAIVALAIFIPVFVIGGTVFKFAVYILSMIALKEYLSVRETRKDFPDFIKLIAYLFLSIIFYNIKVDNEMILSLDFRYLISMLLVLMFPVVLYHDRKKYNINDACYVIAGLLFLSVSMSLGVVYRNKGLEFIVYLLLVTMLTDTFALITGRLIGRHKLLEVVSPNKTWEGFFGGSLIATFVCTYFYITIINANASLYLIIFISLFLTIIGQLGDLFFSAIKRYYGVKDFSNIMPGHGGVLDRFDSLIFVMLTYSLLFSYI